MPDRAAVIIGNRYRPGAMVITCEHASNLVPPPFQVDPSDRPWLETHWGWDIGAAAVTRELVRLLDAVAVLSTFSRLVCDPNRGVDEQTWILDEVEGHPLSFNQNLSDAERRRRRDTYHEPYHQTVDRVLAQGLRMCGGVVMLSMHSFTPHFGDEVRTMEAGVLFDRYPALAKRFAEHLREQGMRTALNEPYSGLAGMMSAAARHGENNGVIYLQLELRQDLVGTAAGARKEALRVSRALESLDLTRIPALRAV